MTNTDTVQRCRIASGKLPKELDRVRACELLSVSRATVYRYIAKGEVSIAHTSSKVWSEEDERLAAKIDDIHLEFPVYGARKIAKLLKHQGEKTTTRYKVGSLMKLMGIRPCYPVPSLSKPAKASRKFPYLLKDKKILFANQVWSTDITYVQIGGKHMYLTAVIDWYSRYIVSWRLSDTMKAQEVVMCVKQAFKDYGTPSIMNSDQGSVFCSDEYVALLSSKGIAQSMDGKARWRDNVIIERWFRTLKSECLRLSEYSTPQELRDIIGKFVESYNSERIHQSLGYETPEMWYFAGIPKVA